MGSTAIEKRHLTILTEKTTTEGLKIAPLGETTFSPDYTGEVNILRIPQEQVFQDFLSNIFETDEVKANYDTSDTDNKLELGIEQFSNSELQQMTETTTIQKDTFQTGEIKQTTEIPDERIHTSLEAIDSIEDPKVKEKVEEKQVESTTRSLTLTSTKVHSSEGSITKNQSEQVLFETVGKSSEENDNPQR